MSVVENTFNLIDRGRSGEVPTLLTNIPKLDEIIHGIKQGYTYLIGGDTGTGKSSFTRSIFIDNVYQQVQAIKDPSKLDAIFVDFTLEIPASLNLAGTLARKAYFEYQKVIPTNRIFSWSHKLEDDDYNIIQSYKEWAIQYQKKLLVIERETDPELYHDTLMEVAKKYGKFSKEGRYIDECGSYTLDNPNLHIFIIFDTLNLAALSSGHTTIKSSIDRISKIGVRFRNKCNFIIVDVQQYNSDLATTDRARFGTQGPNLKDHMDSSGPTKDATVVLGLYSPMRYLRDDQLIWRGYDVAQLKSWLTSLHVLKNRYGQAQKYIPLKFAGAVGCFSQLPEAKDMEQTDYEQATKY